MKLLKGIFFLLCIGISLTLFAEEKVVEKTGDKTSGAFLGVRGKDFDSTIAVDLGSKNGGALVNEVISGSPAEKYGIKISDIIIKCNDVEITNFTSLIGYMKQKKPGDKVDILIFRNGKEIKIPVVLGSMVVIFKEGREWEYKVFFISNKNDTTAVKKVTAKVISAEEMRLKYKRPELKDDKKAVELPLYLEWTYWKPKTGQVHGIVETAYGISTGGPTLLDLSFAGFASLPYILKPLKEGAVWDMKSFEVDGKIGEEFEKQAEGRSWETESSEILNSKLPLEISEKGIKDKDVKDIRNQHYKVIGQKDVSTIFMNFPGCWQVDTKADSKKGVYELTYYFHPEHGFVRWEYKKPNGGQVILDLEKEEDAVTPMKVEVTGELKNAFFPGTHVEVMITGILKDRKGIKLPLPPYPEWAIKKQLSAMFEIGVKVDATGNVTGTPKIKQSTGYPDWDKGNIKWIKEHWEWEKIPSGETEGFIRIKFIWVE